jgi:RimJ/RimL family protein N-acetyltransferase
MLAQYVDGGAPKPSHFGAGITRSPITHEGLTYITRHLRSRDREEIFALRWDDNETTFVNWMLSFTGRMCWMFSVEGTPVSVLGVFPARPRVWEAFAFGTDAWSQVILSMTKQARRYIVPGLMRAGVHRCECRALATHTDSRRWLLSIGFYEEATLKQLGRDGQDYVSYVFRRKA